MKYFRIKNWDTYQHYKDRSPPWIKLHRELLTSETWVSLDDAGRVLAIAIMMLAAATGNKIPHNPAYVRRAAYLNSDPDFSALFDMGFIEIIEENTEVASTKQADARPEESREEESREEEKRSVKISSLKEMENHPLDGHHADWFAEKAPSVNRFSLRDELVLWCRSKGKKYTDYWAALQKWALKKQAEAPPRPSKSHQDENWQMLQEIHGRAV